MGFAKQQMIRYEDSEDIIEWIEDNYDENIEFEGEGWDEAVEAYHDYWEKQYRLEEAERAQEEYDYYIYMTLNDVNLKFDSELTELTRLLKQTNVSRGSTTFYKMVYAHAVTLLEVYFEEVSKTLIISNDSFLKNTLNNVKPFNDTKYKLSELSLNKDNIKKFVLEKMSDHLYHDMRKVLGFIEGIIGHKVVVKTENISKITANRHDIVHRNGKNKTGKELLIDKTVVNDVLGEVKLFVKEFRIAISKM
jgi:hypothetical protein